MILPTPLLPIRETPASAVFSMIAGFLGFACVPVVRSLVAIVLGHRALVLINAHPVRFTGRRIAITGLLFGYAGLAFGIASTLFMLAMFGIPLLFQLFSN